MGEMNAIIRFDEAILVRHLARISTVARGVFSASCAQRLFPAYRTFVNRSERGDGSTLAEILDRVWAHILGDELNAEQVRVAISRCMALIPGEDQEPWVEEQPYADDAASAVAYSLRALREGDPQEAAWAARRAYEATDHHVLNRLGIVDDVRRLAHPVVQAELSRQRRDLEELSVAHASSALFTRLRDRAKTEAKVFFAID